jgi:hypothetical protein
MTDYADLKTQIAEWANRQDWTDALVSSFIRMAEQKLNQELRIDRMISTAVNLATDGCSQLPDDWLQSDLMLIASNNTPTGWYPIHYKARDEFFRQPNTLTQYNYAWNTTSGFYTIEGRTIFFGGPVDEINGINYQLSYYAEVPVFGDLNPSWVYTKYPSLYLHASLMHADLHAVGEEDKAGLMKQLTEDAINKLNAQHQYARTGGSRVSRSRPRSFG